jgi:hypothetical protein
LRPARLCCRARFPPFGGAAAPHSRCAPSPRLPSRRMDVPLFSSSSQACNDACQKSCVLSGFV